MTFSPRAIFPASFHLPMKMFRQNEPEGDKAPYHQDELHRQFQHCAHKKAKDIQNDPIEEIRHETIQTPHRFG
jgi:hypothetical protein